MQLSLVIIAAFEYALNRKRTVRSKICEQKFHRFMDGLFLFSHLWEFFSVSDDNVQDELLFVGEFKRAKNKLEKMKGFSFKKEISDEDWAKAFHDVDKSDDEEVTFGEICEYVTKNIISPRKYANLAISDPSKVEHTNSNRKSMRMFSTHKEKTKRVLALVDQLSFKVDGDTYAVSLNKSKSSRSVLSRQNSGSSVYSVKRQLANKHDDTVIVYEDENVRRIPSRESVDMEDSVSSASYPEMLDIINADMNDNEDSDNKERDITLKDLRNTQKSLSLRTCLLNTETIPDNSKKSEIQEIAGLMRNKRAKTKHDMMNRSAKKFNKTNVKNDNFMKTSKSPRVPDEKKSNEETFASKFPDASKVNPRPRPPGYEKNGPEDDDFDEDLRYIFLTEKKELHGECGVRTDEDSDYMQLDPTDLPDFERKSENVQNSLSIRVQSEYGGSIHTTSMQHLSFDRDTGRAPPHLGPDTSIALSSVNNEEITDVLSPCENKSRTATSQPIAYKFEPLHSYTTRQKSSPNDCKRSSCKIPGKIESPLQTVQYSSLKSRINAIYQNRPASAPSRKVILTCNPQEAVEELEKKYYPPAKKLNYYLQQAKTSPTSRSRPFSPRRTHTVPIHQRQGSPLSYGPPRYHSWMLEDDDDKKYHSIYNPGHIERSEKVPISAKKARAISNLRRHNQTIVR